jgi:hypothetical protein
MNVASILSALEDSSIDVAIAGDMSWEWRVPTVEKCHLLSRTVSFGSIFMMDVRLLGLTSGETSVSKVSAEVPAYKWIAYLCAVIAGWLMFKSKAHVHFYYAQFQLKFLHMLLAGFNLLVFQFSSYRNVRRWDPLLPAPQAPRIAGALSIRSWVR